MIVIYGTLIVFVIMVGFFIFKNLISYSQNPTTVLLISWFFSLLLINIIVTSGIYGYYYYKTKINQYSGNQGIQGYPGMEGASGVNINECISNLKKNN
jgi:hypothetical protein